MTEPETPPSASKSAITRVTIEFGTKTFQGTALALTGAEYDEFAVWVREHNPLLAEYQEKVSLPIPLVVLVLDGLTASAR